MKKILLLSLISLVTLSATLPALALGPVDMDAELAINSQYVWRGMIESSDPVIQPGLSANIMGIGFGFWGNIDTSDINGNEWEFNEIDWTATYAFPLPIVDLEFGLIHYTYPNTDDSSTSEFYVSAESGLLLSPALAYYYDFDENDGAYIEASISHDVAMTPALNLELGAGLGFGSEGWVSTFFQKPTAGLTDFHISAGMPFESIPFFTITPSLAYSTLLGDAKDSFEVLPGEEELDTNALIFGLSASFSF